MNDNRWRLRRRDAGRLALEGVVVVLSILIAFMLDAWSDGRTLQRELNQELASVARELNVNRGLVEYKIHALERVIAGSEALEVRNAILNKASWLGSGLGEMKQLVGQLNSLLAKIRKETGAH